MAIDIVMINNSSIMSDLVCSQSKSQQSRRVSVCLGSMLSNGQDRLMNRNTEATDVGPATTLNIDGRLEALIPNLTSFYASNYDKTQQ